MQTLRLVVILFFLWLFAQKMVAVEDKLLTISGTVISADWNEPLPYATIYNLNTRTGTITNEEGYFSIAADSSDTIRIRFIGHETIKVSAIELMARGEIMLHEALIDLQEVVVAGNILTAEQIIEKILYHYSENYPEKAFRQRVFVRIRDRIDYKTLNIEKEKSSISVFDDDFLFDLTNEVKSSSMSFTDQYGWIYVDEKTDKIPDFMVKPIQTVELREKDMYKRSHVDSVLKRMFLDDDTTSYWKFRSGIIPLSIEFRENDSLNTDSLKMTRARLMTANLRNHYNLVDFNDEKRWEFLHKPGRYRYSLKGITRFKGENVYVISFLPHNKGLYSGQLYVDMENFALLRADYAFGSEKEGRSIHLFGVGYEEKAYAVSLEFEPDTAGYRLRYFSLRSEEEVSADRPLTIVKKRERFLFDKTLEKIKLNLNLHLRTAHNFELLVFETEPFVEAKRPQFKIEPFGVLQVGQFTDSLWSSFQIIEPTKQMRAYRKE